jgi:hypothetical protein
LVIGIKPKEERFKAAAMLSFYKYNALMEVACFLSYFYTSNSRLHYYNSLVPLLPEELRDRHYYFFTGRKFKKNITVNSIVTCRSIARLRQRITSNNRILPLLWNNAVNTTVEESVFSVDQIRESEWSESSAVQEEGFG